MIRGMMTTTTKNMVLLIAILMLEVYQNFMLSQIVSTFSQISACACHSEISLSSNRDTNGYCSCNNGYDGEKCDPCQISSDEFPNCHSGGKFIV